MTIESAPQTTPEIIAGIERQLPKWRAWFPDEQSGVEIPRRDLLMLVEAAKRGLVAKEKLPPDHPTEAT